MFKALYSFICSFFLVFAYITLVLRVSFQYNDVVIINFKIYNGKQM